MIRVIMTVDPLKASLREACKGGMCPGWDGVCPVNPDVTCMGILNCPVWDDLAPIDARFFRLKR